MVTHSDSFDGNDSKGTSFFNPIFEGKGKETQKHTKKEWKKAFHLTKTGSRLSRFKWE